MPDEDIYASGLTTAKGSFVLEKSLKRNTEYAVVATAKGYKSTTYDAVAVDDDADDPLRWSITLR
jgi:hypothetical protein